MYSKNARSRKGSRFGFRAIVPLASRQGFRLKSVLRIISDSLRICEFRQHRSPDYFLRTVGPITAGLPTIDERDLVL
jgi:hypothetical protein